MGLAIFDLDNTLIAGDSDHAWGEFLIAKQAVDEEIYRQANNRFFQQYNEGVLDIKEYLEFALQPLVQCKLEQLSQWREEFVCAVIKPIILTKAVKLLLQHKEAGDELLIITSTNRFITEPIAELLGVDDLIATEPEIKEDKYTGKVKGIPSFREGKIKRLESWLIKNDRDLNGSSFYSDSHNDIPLLQEVERPVAVDPDETLRAHAKLNGWDIISLRDT